MKSIFKLLSLLLLLLMVNLAVVLLRYYREEGTVETPLESAPSQLSHSPPESITLTFAGDLMAHSVNFRMADFSDIYREMIPAIEAGDLAFINLETPVVESMDYATFPRFNVHREYVQAAVDAGFDIFALANNHSSDQGPKGVLATLKTMKELREENREKRPHFTFSGLKGHERSPLVPTSIKVGPWSLGFISLTSFINVWNGHELVYLIDYYRNDQVKEELLSFIRSIDPLYDILIIAVHDGQEYKHQPLSRKELFFQEIAEAGAEVVWGHHSHVLQPWKRLNLPENREAVILHSMGNFISGQIWNIDPESLENERNATGDSSLISITFEKAAPARESLRISSIEPYLAFNYRDPKKGMIVRPYQKILGDEAVPEVWKDFYRDRAEQLAWFTDPKGAPQGAAEESAAEGAEAIESFE
jgi:poly-gamma-glutamate capsule biosynthesis protein CapA/YwtB (metallophosphatase superfamily)